MESYHFFLDLAIILIAAKLFGLLFRKMRLPQVVGMLVAGLIIGPNLLGLVEESEFLTKMAEIGVIMLMFTAGLETDIKELKSTGPAALLIATLGVIVPLIGGYVVFSLFEGGFAPLGTEGSMQAIFMGVIITATSVSITVETLRELGHLRGKVGTAILSAAIIDDIIGIVLLTFVIGFKDPSSSPVQVILSTVAFFAVFTVVGFVINRLFKYFDKKYPHKRRVPIYGFALCLLMAYVAEQFFGIADITGAYVAGIVMCNARSSDYIVQKIDINSYMIFSPIFFTSIGLKTQVNGLTAALFAFTAVYILVALLAKIVGCGLGAKLCRFTMHESLIVGVGMMSRGEVALIVAQKGFAAGLMNPAYFTAVILMVIVSSMVTPIFLKLLYRKEDALAAAQAAAMPAGTASQLTAERED